jgi:hypothetical protein
VGAIPKSQKKHEEYDEYAARISESFAAAWRFFEKHRNPRTSADWDRLTIALSDYRDTFTSDLIIVVVDELEREYKHEITRRPAL